MPFSQQIALLRRGRKALSVLRRANEGYLKPLQNVLSCTYGRKGKRRRELMAKLMQKDIPQDHKAVEALSDVHKFSRDWQPPSMVMALLHSQANNAQRLDRSIVGPGNLRPTPTIAEKNTWGRPMPEKRVKNLMHRWYAKQVDRLMPPLPQHEFERLQALADGSMRRTEGPVTRRKRNPDVQRRSSLVVNENLILEGPKKSHTIGAYAQGRPHQLTWRLLQRIWLKISTHVPLVRWSSKEETWEVSWNVKGRARRHIKEVSDDRLETLFGSPLK